jgi:hypothetical protein
VNMALAHEWTLVVPRGDYALLPARRRHAGLSRVRVGVLDLPRFRGDLGYAARYC